MDIHTFDIEFDPNSQEHLLWLEQISVLLVKAPKGVKVVVFWPEDDEFPFSSEIKM